MTKHIMVVVLLGIVGGTTFLLLRAPREILVPTDGEEVPLGEAPASSTVVLASAPSSAIATSIEKKAPQAQIVTDIEAQTPLPNPPEVVKAIYLTGWTAGSSGGLARSINLIDRTELNAAVIDLKDYSGYLSYPLKHPMAELSGANREIRIARPNAMIKALHDKGIYAIARITVFQDPVLAKQYPEYALQDKVTSSTWKDHKGLSWMDPAARPVWEYLVALAKDAARRGFDEINFDYIRFASDGDLSRIGYPIWGMNETRRAAISRFFKYLRESLPGIKISADLFGLTTVNYDDLGIGQSIEDAYRNFDFVAPMTYPSHYASGFIGLKNPGAYPYEVIQYSMEKALGRLELLEGTSTVKRYAKLRPWFQDFNLGATYDANMVRSQIVAWDEVSASSTQNNAGWFLWNPSNVYTEGALLKE